MASSIHRRYPKMLSFLVQDHRRLHSALPGPVGLPLLGNLHQLVRACKPKSGSPCSQQNFTNALHWISDELHAKYGPVVQISVGTVKQVFISDPDLVSNINKNHPGKFIKGEGYQLTFGDGFLDNSILLTDNAEQWKAKRQMYRKAFSGRNSRSYIAHFVNATDKVSSRWQLAAQGRKELDIQNEFKLLALDVIGTAGFGTPSLSEPGNAFAKAFADHLDYLAWRQNQLFFEMAPGALKWTSHFKRDQQSIRTLTEVSREIILARRDAMKSSTGEQFRDLLSYLMEASDTVGGDVALSDEQLAREVNLFLFAGHDTTSATLSWAWSYINKDSEVRSRLLDEVSRVRPLDGFDGSFEEQRISHQALLSDESMPYLTGVLRESLRLRGPVGLYERRNVDELQVNGSLLPPNTQLVINLYHLHRDKAVWGDDADEFKPERWLKPTDEMKKSFVPFAEGPRICIGMNFAMTQMRVALARLVPLWTSTITRFPDYNLNGVFLPVNGKMQVSPIIGA